MKYKLLLVVLLPLYTYAQKFTINGTIQDATNGESLIGANIYIPTLEVGAVTNNYGFYSLTAEVRDSITILYSDIGWFVYSDENADGLNTPFLVFKSINNMIHKTSPLFWLLPLFVLSLFFTTIIVFVKMEQEKEVDWLIESNCFSKQAILKKELPSKILVNLAQEANQIIRADLLTIDTVKTPVYMIKTSTGKRFFFDKKGELVCQQKILSE